MERKKINHEENLRETASKLVKPQYLDEGEKNLGKLITEDTAPLIVK